MSNASFDPCRKRSGGPSPADWPPASAGPSPRQARSPSTMTPAGPPEPLTPSSDHAKKPDELTAAAREAETDLSCPNLGDLRGATHVVGTAFRRPYSACKQPTQLKLSTGQMLPVTALTRATRPRAWGKAGPGHRRPRPRARPPQSHPAPRPHPRGRQSRRRRTPDHLPLRPFHDHHRHPRPRRPRTRQPAPPRPGQAHRQARLDDPQRAPLTGPGAALSRPPAQGLAGSPGQI